MQNIVSRVGSLSSISLAGVIALMVSLGLVGCSKDPVRLTSAQIIQNLDKGSGNFDRVLQICFSKPLTSTYYHKVIIVTNENVKIAGGGKLRPLASDPDKKCHLRNVYTYINKDSPMNARQLIKDYVVAGNVNQVLVQVYNEKPKAKEKPIAEKLFKDL
ncbi:MAG: hypothetical protein ISEC1_P1772 [Thiomicrorhabdus sp.]|nr:MAG: hypothetical protein ISEC1_P1772 [Thiomicrorhabdus sp.]